MTEIKLYKSSWKGIRLIASSLPFVMIGIWMISKEQIGTFGYIMGWLGVSFFGLGIPLGIFVLFDKRPHEGGLAIKRATQIGSQWRYSLR